MTVTITRDNTPIANSDTVQYYDGSSINTGTVFVVTFSNGTQIAITGYDDKEVNDIMLGVPTPSGAIDTVNLYMWGINDFQSGATFGVYAYSGGSLGSLLYTYDSTGHNNATFQFTYDTSSGNLGIAFDQFGGYPDTDGTIAGFSGSSVYAGPACYLRGTRILTATGEVAVETLKQGDLVATRFGGLRPVRWIGTQNFIGLNAAGMLAPVCIRAGALGPSQPRHDLWVSPGHAVLVQDRLVCAYLLLNGTTIVQPAHTGAIAYVHIDLGTHDCVLAEGAWSETYYEHLNRDEFDNAASFHARFPGQAPTIQPTCLPYVNQPDHPALAALRAALPAPPAPAPADLPADPCNVHLVADPCNVHLVADDQLLLPQRDAQGWRFHLPAGVRRLRLRSRAASPHAAHGLPDHRRLGLRLRAVTLSHAGGETALDLASPALSGGWHTLETAHGGPWRWTDGDAEIPAALLGTLDAPATLTLHGYGMKLPGANAAQQRLALAG